MCAIGAEPALCTRHLSVPDGRRGGDVLVSERTFTGGPAHGGVHGRRAQRHLHRRHVVRVSRPRSGPGGRSQTCRDRVAGTPGRGHQGRQRAAPGGARSAPAHEFPQPVFPGRALQAADHAVGGRPARDGGGLRCGAGHRGVGSAQQVELGAAREFCARSGHHGSLPRVPGAGR